MHGTKHLPSFDLSYCFGDVVFLLGMGLNALLISCRNCNDGIREAGSSNVGHYILLTMRSERSPQGSRATDASGLSSGGGGWGTQL